MLHSRWHHSISFPAAAFISIIEYTLVIRILWRANEGTKSTRIPAVGNGDDSLAVASIVVNPLC
jgi:hypothetical protein